MPTNFIDVLAEGPIRFAYRKANGDLRLALGTKNIKYVPDNFLPKGTGVASSSDVHRYWDLNVGAWRSFDEWRMVWNEIDGFTDHAEYEDREQLIHMLITANKTKIQ